jgi:hypothetical protein
MKMLSGLGYEITLIDRTLPRSIPPMFLECEAKVTSPQFSRPEPFSVRILQYRGEGGVMVSTADSFIPIDDLAGVILMIHNAMDDILAYLRKGDDECGT